MCVNTEVLSRLWLGVFDDSSPVSLFQWFAAVCSGESDCMCTTCRFNNVLQKTFCMHTGLDNLLWLGQSMFTIRLVLRWKVAYDGIVTFTHVSNCFQPFGAHGTCSCYQLLGRCLDSNFWLKLFSAQLTSQNTGGTTEYNLRTAP